MRCCANDLLLEWLARWWGAATYSLQFPPVAATEPVNPMVTALLGNKRLVVG
ncbi:MAG: hypothetical protein AAF609_19805 [Cyanobacteria bacterium P01_C01_bin.120]